MKLFLLDKVVLEFSGNVEQLLNGLTANSLDKPHNAFLNQHGRIVATFDQLNLGGDRFLVVIEKFAYERLMSHIAKFLMLNRSQVQVLPWNCYFDLDGDYVLKAQEWAVQQKHGQLILTASEYPSSVTPDAFTIFRLQHGIPIQGVDYTDEFLLNVDEFAHVSYTKGCFLGQEPVAKVHNRSRPTWKLVVRLKDELDSSEQLKMTSVSVDPETGKICGFVFIKNQDGQL